MLNKIGGILIVIGIIVAMSGDGIDKLESVYMVVISGMICMIVGALILNRDIFKSNTYDIVGRAL